MIARRALLALTAAFAAGGAFAAASKRRRDFDVHAFGAKGDGKSLDTAAIQKAIDAAAARGGGARVLFRTGRQYLTGALTLRGGTELHLAGDAQLVASARPEDYASSGGGSAFRAAGVSGPQALLHAVGAKDLVISGTGSIDGRSPEFMERYDPEGEWWVPKAFRPRLLVLEDCERLTIRDVTFKRAPSWTVHLLGCRHVLIDKVTILNQRDVPNCDGIDPDHCQDVEIRNCRITCGDDAIVIKTTAGHDRYGPSHGISVRDCILETQDSGLKIGTETTQDIYDVLFERCRITAACRGLCIQLRDGGNVRDIVFRQIQFDARYFSAPWWGRGEAISFTAIPRNPATQVGTIRNVLVSEVLGQAENSVRVEGLGGGRVSDIRFEKVLVTLRRHTAYPGEVFDNRPTNVVAPLEKHGTPGVSVRHADRVTFRDCAIQWGVEPPDYYTYALEAEDAPGLDATGLAGMAAHPARDPARVIR